MQARRKLQKQSSTHEFFNSLFVNVSYSRLYKGKQYSNTLHNRQFKKFLRTNCEIGIKTFCFLFSNFFFVTSSSQILTNSNIVYSSAIASYSQVELKPFQDFSLYDEYSVQTLNILIQREFSPLLFLAVYMLLCVYIGRKSNYLYFLCTFYSTLGLWQIYKKPHQDE